MCSKSVFPDGLESNKNVSSPKISTACLFLPQTALAPIITKIEMNNRLNPSIYIQQIKKYIKAKLLTYTLLELNLSQ